MEGFRRAGHILYPNILYMICKNDLDDPTKFHHDRHFLGIDTTCTCIYSKCKNNNTYGVIPAHTPRGVRYVYVSMSLLTLPSVSPSCRVVMEQACSTTSVVQYV